MAIDARIPLAAQATDLSRLPGQLQVMHRTNLAREEQPYRNALLEAQEAGQVANTAGQVAQTGERARLEEQTTRARQAAFANRALNELAALPMEQREARHAALEAQAAELEFPVTPGPDDLSDEALANGIAATDAALAQYRLASGGQSAAQKFFESQIAGLSPEEQAQARRIDVGLDPRAVGSSTMTMIQQPGLVEQVAGAEGDIAGAKAGAKTTAENVADLATGPQAAQAMAKAREEGKAEGIASAGFDRGLNAAENVLSVVSQIPTHPGLDIATGLSSTTDPRNFIPGTDAFSFNVLTNQLQGQVFLEAYEGLKGGGTITEIEGGKAEQALARLNKATTADQYIDAANEFGEAVRRGVMVSASEAGREINEIGGLPIVRNAEQARQVPSGELYIEEDGKVYRRP